jgi:hypothetical protein
MIDIRKLVTLREAVYADLGRAAAWAVIRAVGLAVIRNPYARRSAPICGNCSRPARRSASG